MIICKLACAVILQMEGWILRNGWLIKIHLHDKGWSENLFHCSKELFNQNIDYFYSWNRPVSFLRAMWSPSGRPTWPASAARPTWRPAGQTRLGRTRSKSAKTHTLLMERIIRQVTPYLKNKWFVSIVHNVHNASNVSIVQNVNIVPHSITAQKHPLMTLSIKNWFFFNFTPANFILKNFFKIFDFRKKSVWRIPLHRISIKLANK